ncbi:DUF1566 domain-containing protein [Thaumasiovibrio subtropicus]|uniref:Lcl domain-containing protein n=1 Tax=Thaumasiovibrio subtropicus TaxID=1891207 RepID=UPI000B357A56|nr:DUF1566 domain-containing protein [Thaumasiovibrio subtropicus]
MTILKRSLLGLSIAVALSACGGGGGGSNGEGGSPTPEPVPPTPVVTKTVTGFLSGYAQDTTVRLLAEGKVLLSSTAQTNPGESQPRYQFDVDSELVDEDVSLTLEVVTNYVPKPTDPENIPETKNSTLGTPSDTSNSATTPEYISLFKTEIGTRAELFAFDLNQDGIVEGKEFKSLYLSGTSSVLTALSIETDNNLNETVSRIGREKFLALSAWVHAWTASNEDGNALVDLHKEHANHISHASIRALSLQIDQLIADSGNKSNVPPAADTSNSNDGATKSTVTPSEPDTPTPMTANEAVLAFVAERFTDEALITAINAQLTKQTELLANVPYTDVLRELIDSTYSQRSLTLQGEILESIANGAQRPQITIQIGNFKNDPKKVDYYDKVDRPKRPVDLAVRSQNKTAETFYPQGNDFTATITLRDTADTFESCSPTGMEVRGDYDSFKQWDNMQDLLTAIVYDPNTGTEMRSFLGAFCEIATLDSNKDGVVDSDEMPALKMTLEQAAHAILAERSGLVHHGGKQYATPTSQAAIAQLYNKHPLDQVEFMMTIIAMQIAGADSRTGIVPDSADDFFKTAATLLDLDYSADNRMYGNPRGNEVPAITVLLNMLQRIEDVSFGLRDNDMTMTQLLAETTREISQLSQFESDKDIGDAIIQKIYNNGAWLPSAPVEGLDSTCQQVMKTDQLRGIGLRGQGEGWMTVGWSPNKNSSEYTLHWDTKPFTKPEDAAYSTTTQKTVVTIDQLEKYTEYHFMISHTGTPSAPFSFRHGDAGLKNARVVDFDDSCNQALGYAHNSDVNGYRSLNLLKIDEQGAPLERQDLHYQAAPFACVTETQQGRTWAIPNAVQEDGDIVPHFYGAENRYIKGNDITVEDNDFNGFCVDDSGNRLKTDLANQCNTERLVERVNAANYCGINNWRLPNMMELRNIMLTNGETLDDNFFPDMETNREFWFEWTNPYKNEFGYVQQFINSQQWGKLTPRTTPKNVVLVSDGLNLKQQ